MQGPAITSAPPKATRVSGTPSAERSTPRAKAAGITEVRFAAACLGLSGGPHDKEALVREMIAAEHYRITNDAVIALLGATAGEPGVIAIAGTGSIAYGRNAEGRTARAGGWGYVFGDEGGAFDLVRQAVRASLRKEEGWGHATALREALLEATGASDMNDLLHRFYTPAYPRARIASYAVLVDEAARNGDARRSRDSAKRGAGAGNLRGRRAPAAFSSRRAGADFLYRRRLSQRNPARAIRDAGAARKRRAGSSSGDGSRCGRADRSLPAGRTPRSSFECPAGRVMRRVA